MSTAKSCGVNDDGRCSKQKRCALLKVLSKRDGKMGV